MFRLTKELYSQRLLILLCFVIFTVSMFSYREILNHGFMNWDDPLYILNNERIRALNFENLAWMFGSSTAEAANWHPLTWLSHALDYALYGLDPWGHHLNSMILHSVNSVLVFFLTLLILQRLQKVSKSPFLATHTESSENKTLFAAMTSALLFAVHPQHVEVVAWAAERKELLSFFFTLITFIVYLHFTAQQQPRARKLWFIVTFVCFILALMSKPMAVTIPALLLVADIFLLQRIALGTFRTIEFRKKLLLLFIEKVPFFLVSLIIAVVTIIAQSEGGAMSSTGDMPMSIRIINAFNSILLYISKFLFPFHSSPIYGYGEKGDVVLFFLQHLHAIIAFFLISAICVYLAYRKVYYYLFIWLFYLISLSPVVGIIQVGIQSSADRYAYFPTLPFYILVGLGFAQIAFSTTNRQRAALMLGLLISICVLMITLTQAQARIWKNPFIFWFHTVASDPENYYTQGALASVYMAIGYYDRAIAHYRAAIKLNWMFFRFYDNLAKAYVLTDKPEQALETYEYLIANKFRFPLLLSPTTPDIQTYDVVHTRVGQILCLLERFDEAREEAQTAIQINPENDDTKQLLRDIEAMQCNNPFNDDLSQENPHDG